MAKISAFSLRRATQRGFTLIELIVAISISALLAVYAQSTLMRDAEEGLAASSGNYLSTVANATQQMVLVNWNNYSNNLPVPGYANPLAPTIAELTSGAFLNGGFPTSMPTKQVATPQVVASNCPGATCRLDIRVCTTTPINLGGTTTRLDLASTMVSSQNGAGAQVLNLPVGGLRLIGPTMNVAAPVGFVEGMVCGTSNVDTTLYNTFVKMGDSRDPNLAGNLTVAGATTLMGPSTVNNTLNVTGAITGVTENLGAANCINMDGTSGKAGFGCAVGTDLPVGYTGGVRSPDVVANKNILVSDSPSNFTGANTNYAIVTANNGAGSAEIRTSGRAAADRLVPSGAYVAGAACADDGAIAKKSGGSGLVVCQSASWRDLTVSALPGDACAVEGASSTGPTGVLAICMNGAYRAMNTMIAGATPGTACALAGSIGMDTANGNAAVICRANPAPGGGVARWMRMTDITSNLSFVDSVEVTEGQVVAKPTCTPGAGMTSLPLIMLIPKTFSSSDGGVAFYADSGASWVVHMRNGAGNPMVGTPYAVAQVYCYYP